MTFNLSGVSNRNLIGKILRLPLRLLPSEMKVPILQGGLRGKKWIVGSGTHGCWLGSYEQEKQVLFAETIRKDSVVYDVGANVGFYTLLSSELTGRSGKVYAFEPLPRNIRYLKEHIRINRCVNVSLIEAAVADKEGVAEFDGSQHSSMGKIAPGGNIQVRVVSLDELVSKGEIMPPDIIKMDIEGAELYALHGAKDLLCKYHPIIFLSIHGPDIDRACRDFLTGIGYRLESFNVEDEIICRFGELNC